MADFCARCVVDVMGQPEGADNDFSGWLAGRLGHCWGMCEGCGLHLFNDRGERRCRSGETPVLDVCGSCEDLYHAGAVTLAETFRQPHCCNCNARLGFAIVSGATSVGPTLAASVPLGDGRVACLLCFYPF